VSYIQICHKKYIFEINERDNISAADRLLGWGRHAHVQEQSWKSPPDGIQEGLVLDSSTLPLGEFGCLERNERKEKRIKKHLNLSRDIKI